MGPRVFSHLAIFSEGALYMCTGVGRKFFRFLVHLVDPSPVLADPNNPRQPWDDLSDLLLPLPPDDLLWRAFR